MLLLCMYCGEWVHEMAMRYHYKRRHEGRERGVNSLNDPPVSAKSRGFLKNPDHGYGTRG